VCKREKPVVLARIRITGFRREPLNQMTQTDCVAEGFPEMSPSEFIRFFSEHNKCPVDAIISRIEFEYI